MGLRTIGVRNTGVWKIGVRKEKESGVKIPLWAFYRRSNDSFCDFRSGEMSRLYRIVSGDEAVLYPSLLFNSISFSLTWTF